MEKIDVPVWQSRTRLFIDLPSLIWTSLKAGTDQENGVEVEFKGKPKIVNSPEFAVDSAINTICSVFTQFSIQPVDTVIVRATGDTKVRRQAIYGGYKPSGDKHELEYKHFDIACNMFVTQMRAIGAMYVSQGGVEEDDIIAYLVRRTEGVRYIWSRDGDLCTLLELDGVAQIKSGEIVTSNPYGDFNPKYIPVYKALVGDSTEYKGIPQFGKAAFDALYQWGGENCLKVLNHYLTINDVEPIAKFSGQCKALDKVIDGWEAAATCLKLAKLHDDWVNTLNLPLVFRGMRPVREDNPALAKWAQTVQVVTSDNFDAALREVIELSSNPWAVVSLDIEAATCEESKEWVAARVEKSEIFDTLGFVPTSIQLTVGANSNKSYFFPVNHTESDGVLNLPRELVVKLLETLTKHKFPTIIQNFSFEGPVLAYRYPEAFKDGWLGQLPNVIDTAVLAKYVDENESASLKSRSAKYLNYQQATYEATTTFVGLESELRATRKGGIVRQVLDVAYDYTSVQLAADLSEYAVFDNKLYVRATEGRKTVKVEVPLEACKDLETQGVNYSLIKVEPETAGNIEVELSIDNFPTEPGIYIKVLRDRKVCMQYEMDELSVSDVIKYGIDDTVCTAGLYHLYRLITETEGTYRLFEELEPCATYLTNQAYLQGFDFDLGLMLQQEAEDNNALVTKHLPTIEQYLIKHNYEGTICPRIDPDAPTPADIKAVWEVISGTPLVTMVRKIDKLGLLIGAIDHEHAELVSESLISGNYEVINRLADLRFSAKPQFDAASSKQLGKLMYRVMGLPVRLINPPTETQRKEDPELTRACYKHSALVRVGGDIVAKPDEIVQAAEMRHREMTRDERNKNPAPLSRAEAERLIEKAKADEDAINFAIKFDLNPDDERVPVLKAILAVKTIETRNSLFYKKYRGMLHWSDNKIHPNARQYAAATSRWSYTDPNFQQLPKRGEGKQFRKNIKPHKKNAVICSVDFNGQELRLQAGLSKDPEMLACYVGDNKRDMHSLTASTAMTVLWSVETYDKAMASLNGASGDSYEIFRKLLASDNPEISKLAGALRRDSKTVNFGSAYGCDYPKMQVMLCSDFNTAVALLDAKRSRFDGFERWKVKVESEALQRGYARTLRGTIRHLQKEVTKENQWEKAAAARKASNFEVQCAGAELTKAAMRRIFEQRIFERYDAKFIAPIHDEIVWSCAIEDVYATCKAVWEAVSQPYTPDFPVEFLGSVSFGLNFGDQIELADDPILPEKAVFIKTLKELFPHAEIHA